MDASAVAAPYTPSTGSDELDPKRSAMVDRTNQSSCSKGGEDGNEASKGVDDKVDAEAANSDKPVDVKPACKRHSREKGSRDKKVNKKKQKQAKKPDPSSSDSSDTDASDLSSDSLSDSASGSAPDSSSESESDHYDDESSSSESDKPRRKSRGKSKKVKKPSKHDKNKHRKPRTALSDSESDADDGPECEPERLHSSRHHRRDRDCSHARPDDYANYNYAGLSDVGGIYYPPPTQLLVPSPSQLQQQIEQQQLTIQQQQRQLQRMQQQQQKRQQRDQSQHRDQKPEKERHKKRGSQKACKSEGRRSRSPSAKRASRVEFKRVDQLWDRRIHNYKLRETVDDSDASEWDRYIFTVRRNFNWENHHVDTVVSIKSKPLRDALAYVMDGVKSVSLVQESPVLDPNILFLYLEETRAYRRQLKAQLAVDSGKDKDKEKSKARRLLKAKADHLRVLIRYLDTDYADIKRTLYPLLAAHTITFDLLWALFKPNSLAYTPTYGSTDEPRAFKIDYATKESSFSRGTWYSVEGRYLEYDGKAFGMGNIVCDVDSFKGPRKISSLACYPIDYHPDPADLRSMLLERGKKFVSLQGMNYRFHRGLAFYKKRRCVVKVNVNGRVMVDPVIHRRINPNYPISNVRPKEPYFDSDDESDDGCTCGVLGDDFGDSGGDHQTKTRYRVLPDADGTPRVIAVECDEQGNPRTPTSALENRDSPEFTEEDLTIASPVALGFSFNEKLWLEFAVSGLSPIVWNATAFDSLVLPANQKSIVRALVESHAFAEASNIDDIIQGKGRGLVAVLHGPPGTGKTLTAEGIAELLRRPLYMVSAGELGTDSRLLEGELAKILDIAHSWGAVLLLDEADVFLEKRSVMDIHRNALVSIFLRLLEYFQGILFLTTNRVETFDDAFQSRIHVALRYGDLGQKAKRSIWKMFLDKVMALDEAGKDAAVDGDGNDEGKRGASTSGRPDKAAGKPFFTEKDYDALSRRHLNGRQIKNYVRAAQALALNEKTPLNMEHIIRVVDVAETFDADLKGGTGYLDAMRSYT